MGSESSDATRREDATRKGVGASHDLTESLCAFTGLLAYRKQTRSTHVCQLIPQSMKLDFVAQPTGPQPAGLCSMPVCLDACKLQRPTDPYSYACTTLMYACKVRALLTPGNEML